MEELEAMSFELQKLQSKQAESEKQSRQANVMSEWKHQEKEKRQSGKSEFYLKRGTFTGFMRIRFIFATICTILTTFTPILHRGEEEDGRDKEDGRSVSGQA